MFNIFRIIAFVLAVSSFVSPVNAQSKSDAKISGIWFSKNSIFSGGSIIAIVDYNDQKYLVRKEVGDFSYPDEDVSAYRLKIINHPAGDAWQIIGSQSTQLYVVNDEVLKLYTGNHLDDTIGPVDRTLTMDLSTVDLLNAALAYEAENYIDENQTQTYVENITNLYRELIMFLAQDAFKINGFSQGTPYYDWLQELQALSVTSQ